MAPHGPKAKHLVEGYDLTPDDVRAVCTFWTLGNVAAASRESGRCRAHLTKLLRSKPARALLQRLTDQYTAEVCQMAAFAHATAIAMPPRAQTRDSPGQRGVLDTGNAIYPSLDLDQP